MSGLAAVGGVVGGGAHDHLLQALAEGKADMDGDAQITVEEVLDWIKPRVSREAAEAGRQQTPRRLEGSADDDLVLLHGLSR